MHTNLSEDVKINLLNKVEIITETGCWIWHGAVTKAGYGTAQVNSKPYRAHRVFYEMLVGKIPDRLVIDHLCRVRCCVNPSHLEPVTNKENILRGTSPQAINGKKTHCINGHELTEDNMIPYVNWRQCKICWYKLHNRLNKESRARKALIPSTQAPSTQIEAQHMPEHMRELARKVIESQKNDTRTDNEKYADAVSFICDGGISDSTIEAPNTSGVIDETK